MASVVVVIRWLSALAVATVLTGFAFLLITGRYLNDGAVVVRFTARHGIHQGDVFVISGWVVAMVGLVYLVARGGGRWKQ